MERYPPLNHIQNSDKIQASISHHISKHQLITVLTGVIMNSVQLSVLQERKAMTIDLQINNQSATISISACV